MIFGGRDRTQIRNLCKWKYGGEFGERNGRNGIVDIKQCRETIEWEKVEQWRDAQWIQLIGKWNYW